MLSILGINDNPINLALLKQVIKRVDNCDTVVTASDGQKALDYYENLKSSQDVNVYPKIVFLDINMPVMDGWEFLEKFSTRYLPLFKETKVVITSSSINPADSERAKTYPCVVDFLTTHLTVDYVQNLTAAS